MDAATLQAKIYAGYAQSALRIGYVFTQYRPSGITNPIVTGNIVTTLNAAFSPATQTGFPFNKPSNYKNILWAGLCNGSGTLPGDYLVASGHGTYFIAIQQDLLPPLCVLCTRVVTVTRSNEATGGGTQPYAGVTPANSTTILSGFPAGQQPMREGGRPEGDVPSDASKVANWSFYLPLLPGGAEILERDIITDDLGKRYMVVRSYLSNLGYEVACQQLEA